MLSTKHSYKDVASARLSSLSVKHSVSLLLGGVTAPQSRLRCGYMGASPIPFTRQLTRQQQEQKHGTRARQRLTSSRVDLSIAVQKYMVILIIQRIIDLKLMCLWEIRSCEIKV